MKTFREALIWSAFEDAWPSWSNAKERVAHYEQMTGPGAEEMRMARRLGQWYRAAQFEPPALETEFDTLAGNVGSFQRWKQAHPEGWRYRTPESVAANHTTVLMSQDIWDDTV